MTVVIVLIMALGTLAFVFSPYFRHQNSRNGPVRMKAAGRRQVHDDEIEQMVLKVRQQQKVRVCPRCGARNAVNARYCTQCAASLNKGKRNG